ncbi:hypothetical protein BABINDRAFT_6353 [Babjeviella inositovora NRRL Y-12698]|uniref:VPS9 domain-containing protein n=1 Tax=Babjeviella inositovora NRRL Y-12698 TaxID=984486 RepID=A0A1E3QVJ7_9ASCO|nr:uncharacterized protein BABINDRAFT_6353 [Babjeviella inositovora NRRL Y-12698]ODQ81686.1 hypothetical protein BABINDRAFT_6353 [Babjeviella inositovora NRRL Y-12698]
MLSPVKFDKVSHTKAASPRLSTLTHLPLLRNPLLNNIFNNPPRHHSTKFKAIVASLSELHAQCIVLVPPTETLIHSRDSISGKPYHELSYNEDFISSHIARPSPVANDPTPGRFTSATSPLSYTTLNGKTILVKGDRIFKLSGFRVDASRPSSLEDPVLVTHVDLFPNFAGYFPMGALFQVMHISEPLDGIPVNLKRVYVKQTISESTVTVKSPTSSLRKSTDISIESFETILRRYPLITKFVGKEYTSLFEKFTLKPPMPEDTEAMCVAQLEKKFLTTYNQACYIFNQKVPVSLLREVVREFPDPSNVDFNAVIHDYVETNMYDRIWAALLWIDGKAQVELDGSQTDGLCLPEIYESLASLTLNQVGLPSGFTTTEINSISKHVRLAIETFRGLSWANSSDLKRKVLLKTFHILTTIPALGVKDRKLVIDADTLVSILHLVVVHSRVPHLPVHITYLRQFSYKAAPNTAVYSFSGFPDDLNSAGMFSYVLSTVEAVVYHLLTDSEHLLLLQQCSARNRELWNLIESQDQQALAVYMEREIPAVSAVPFSEHALWSRDVELGDSCLMKAVQANAGFFRAFFDHTETLFMLEDLLADENHEGTTLVVAALRSECTENVDLMVQTLFASDLTSAELSLYFNRHDQYNRHVGHYLFHDYQLLESFPEIGDLLDWEDKDINGSTALVAIFRSYDHHHYLRMIESALHSCLHWYSSQGKVFDYSKHVDDRGNTLVHIVQDDLSGILRILRESNALGIDLNQKNHKSLTPLMIYAKYNRAANIGTLLKDDRISIKESNRDHWNIFDYIVKTPEIEMPITARWFETNVPKVHSRQIGVLNGRYDTTNNEWKLLTKGAIHEKAHTTMWYSKYNQESTFRLLMDLFRREFVCGLVMSPDEVLQNFPVKGGGPSANGNVMPLLFKKIRVDRLIDQLNKWFVFISFNELLMEHELLWEFVILPDFPDMRESLEARIDEKVANGIDIYKDRVFLVQEINAVEVFLTCSCLELSKQAKFFERLYRVATFSFLKHRDLLASESELIPESLVGVPFVLTQLQDTLDGVNKRDLCSPQCQLKEYMLLFKQLVEELAGKMHVSLKRINEWWAVHRLITANNKELLRLEGLMKPEIALSVSPREEEEEDADDNATVFTTLSSESALMPGSLMPQETAHGFDETAPLSDTPTSVQVETHLSKVASTASALLFFVKIESKHDKYKRLLVTRSTLTTTIMALNKRIAFDQASFGTELRNLKAMREGVMRFAMTQFAQESVRVQKCRLGGLRESLEKLRG